MEVSASSDSKSSVSEASSFSAGASTSYGFFGLGIGLELSAEGSHNEESAHSQAMSELVNSSVRISFQCMRVDITRPWLRPELFYDEDLVPGTGVK